MEMKKNNGAPSLPSSLSASPNLAALSASRGGSTLLMLSIVFIIGLIAGALYLSFQKSAINDQQKLLDAEVADLNTQINQLKTQKIEAAQAAQQWLNDIEKGEIRWSAVLKGLQELIPLDPSGQPKIRFLSYSGAAGGKLTLNAETVPSTLPDFDDIIQLVNLFNTSNFFKDGYVPSISRGVSETGQTILSFIFNVTYVPESSSSSFDASGAASGLNLSTPPSSTSGSSVSGNVAPSSTSSSTNTSAPTVTTPSAGASNPSSNPTSSGTSASAPKTPTPAPKIPRKN